MTKRPSFQFYPADWRKDAELQSCSIAARGLWHELMCVMHECEPYGHLTVNGKAMAPAQAARLVGVSQREYDKLLKELIAAGVPSFTTEGVMYSRRMVRDSNERDKWKERQARHRGTNDNVTANVTHSVTRQSRRSSSSSSSSPSSSKELSSDKSDLLENQNAPEGKKTKHLQYPSEFESFWSEYPTDKLMSKKQAFERWKRLSVDDRRAAQASLTGFRDYCRKNPNYRPIHAERYITQRRFDGFVDAAQGNGTGPPEAPDAYGNTRSGYETMVKGFAETGIWPRLHDGPAPGEKDCRAPPDIQRKYGFKPFGEDPDNPESCGASSQQRAIH